MKNDWKKYSRFRRDRSVGIRTITPAKGIHHKNGGPEARFFIAPWLLRAAITSPDSGPHGFGARAFVTFLFPTGG